MELDEMLSGLDIINWFHDQGFEEPEIVTYRELPNLNKDRCLFVLYESQPRIGHWTIVFYNEPDSIWEFFDPYGYCIDDQLDFSFYKDMDHQLTKKLIGTGDPQYEINDLQFQKKRSGINTCGKQCCIRYWASQMGLTKEDYDTIFYNEIVLDNRDRVINNLFNSLCS